MSSVTIATAHLWPTSTDPQIVMSEPKRIVSVEWRKGYAGFFVALEEETSEPHIFRAVETRHAKTRKAALRAFCAMIEKHNPEAS